VPERLIYVPIFNNSILAIGSLVGEYSAVIPTTSDPFPFGVFLEIMSVTISILSFVCIILEGGGGATESNMTLCKSRYDYLQKFFLIDLIWHHDPTVDEKSPKKK